jgi:hypothetical protein
MLQSTVFNDKTNSNPSAIDRTSMSGAPRGSYFPRESREISYLSPMHAQLADALADSKGLYNPVGRTILVSPKIYSPVVPLYEDGTSPLESQVGVFELQCSEPSCRCPPEMIAIVKSAADEMLDLEPPDDSEILNTAYGKVSVPVELTSANPILAQAVLEWMLANKPVEPAESFETQMMKNVTGVASAYKGVKLVGKIAETFERAKQWFKETFERLVAGVKNQLSLEEWTRTHSVIAGALALMLVSLLSPVFWSHFKVFLNDFLLINSLALVAHVIGQACAGHFDPASYFSSPSGCAVMATTAAVIIGGEVAAASQGKHPPYVNQISTGGGFNLEAPLNETNGRAALLAGIITLLTFDGDAPSLKGSSFLKRFGIATTEMSKLSKSINAGIGGIQVFMSILPECVQRVIAKVGLSPTELDLSTQYGHLLVWACNFMGLVHGHPELLDDIDVLKQFVGVYDGLLYGRVREISALDPRSPEAAKIKVVLDVLKPHYLSAKRRLGNSVRVEPVGVFFFGAAGLGKSHGLMTLVRECYPGHPNITLYSRSVAELFWGGYSGQKVVLYDEITTTPNDNLDIASELCRNISNLPTAVSMPEAHDKGMLFTSELVLATGNSDLSAIARKGACPDATLRRFMHYRVSILPQYVNAEGRFDEQKALTMSRDERDWSVHLRYERVRYLPDGKQKCIERADLTLQEVVAEVRAALSLKKAAFEMNVADADAHYAEKEDVPVDASVLASLYAGFETEGNESSAEPKRGASPCSSDQDDDEEYKEELDCCIDRGSFDRALAEGECAKALRSDGSTNVAAVDAEVLNDACILEVGGELIDDAKPGVFRRIRKKFKDAMLGCKRCPNATGDFFQRVTWAGKAKWVEVSKKATKAKESAYLRAYQHHATMRCLGKEPRLPTDDYDHDDLRSVFAALYGKLTLRRVENPQPAIIKHPKLHCDKTAKRMLGLCTGKNLALFLTIGAALLGIVGVVMLASKLLNGWAGEPEEDPLDLQGRAYERTRLAKLRRGYKASAHHVREMVASAHAAATGAFSTQGAPTDVIAVAEPTVRALDDMARCGAIVSVHTPNDVRTDMNAWVIGSKLLMPYHYLTVRGLMIERIDPSSTIAVAMSDGDGGDMSLSFMLGDADLKVFTDASGREIDVCTLSLPKLLKPLTSIHKRFCGSTASDSSDWVKLEPAADIFCTPIQPPNVFFSPKEYEFHGFVYYTPARLETAISRKGACGALYVSLKPHLRVHAMHVGGDNGVGIALPISLPIDGFETQAVHSMVTDDVVDSKQVAPIAQSRPGYVSVARTLIPAPPARATNLRPSPLLESGADFLLAEPYSPAMTGVRGEPSKTQLLWNILGPEQLTDLNLDSQHHELLKDLVIDQAMSTGKTGRIFGLNEILNFAEGYPGSSPMNMSTSSGFPLSTQKGVLGKRPYLGYNDAGERVVFDARLLVAFERYDTQLLEGRAEKLPFVLSTKDELRKASKQGQPRVVSGPHLVHSMVCRKYFGAFIGAHQEYRPTSKFIVGMNIGSRHWGEMIRNMREVGDWAFDGDFKGMNAYMDDQVAELILAGVEAFYEAGPDYDPAHALIRKFLFSSIVSARVLIGSDLYDVEKGGQAGAVGTTIWNCFLCLILLGHCYFDATLAHPRLRSVAALNANTRMKIYGDDNFVSVSPELERVFNFNAVQRAMKRMNVEYTPADKSDVAPDLVPILTGEMLKCTTYERDFGIERYSAKPKPGFNKSLLYVRKSQDPFMAIVTNVNMTLRRLHGGGRAFFYKWRAKYVDALAKAGIVSPNLLTFSDVEADFVAGTMRMEDEDDLGWVTCGNYYLSDVASELPWQRLNIEYETPRDRWKAAYVPVSKANRVVTRAVTSTLAGFRLEMSDPMGIQAEENPVGVPPTMSDPSIPNSDIVPNPVNVMVVNDRGYNTNVTNIMKRKTLVVVNNQQILTGGSIMIRSALHSWFGQMFRYYTSGVEVLVENPDALGSLMGSYYDTNEYAVGTAALYRARAEGPMVKMATGVNHLGAHLPWISTMRANIVPSTLALADDFYHSSGRFIITAGNGKNAYFGFSDDLTLHELCYVPTHTLINPPLAKGKLKSSGFELQMNDSLGAAFSASESVISSVENHAVSERSPGLIGANDAMTYTDALKRRNIVATGRFSVSESAGIIKEMIQLPWSAITSSVAQLAVSSFVFLSGQINIEVVVNSNPFQQGLAVLYHLGASTNAEVSELRQRLPSITAGRHVLIPFGGNSTTLLEIPMSMLVDAYDTAESTDARNSAGYIVLEVVNALETGASATGDQLFAEYVITFSMPDPKLQIYDSLGVFAKKHFKPRLPGSRAQVLRRPEVIPPLIGYPSSVPNCNHIGFDEAKDDFELQGPAQSMLAAGKNVIGAVKKGVDIADKVTGVAGSLFDKPNYGGDPLNVVRGQFPVFTHGVGTSALPSLDLGPGRAHLPGPDDATDSFSNTDIQKLCERPTFHDSFEWRAGEASSYVLWVGDLTPTPRTLNANYEEGAANVVFQPTLLEHIASRFVFGRVGLRYTFYVVAAKPMSGKMMICVSYNRFSVDIPDNQAAAAHYYVVYDFAMGDRVFTVDVPYVSAYRKIRMGRHNVNYATTPTPFMWSMGQISARVLTPLQSPETCANKVIVNVLVAALPGAEFDVIDQNDGERLTSTLMSP